MNWKSFLLVPFLVVCAWAADVTGKWEFAVETTAGNGTPTFELVQKGEQISGKYSGALGEARVTGSVKGDEIEIEFEVSGAKVLYVGKILADGTMKGTVDLAGEANGTWTGRRSGK